MEGRLGGLLLGAIVVILGRLDGLRYIRWVGNLVGGSEQCGTGHPSRMEVSLPFSTLMRRQCAGRCRRTFCGTAQRRRVSVGPTALVHILFDDDGVVEVRFLFLGCWLALPNKRHQLGGRLGLEGCDLFHVLPGLLRILARAVPPTNKPMRHNTWAHALLPPIMPARGSDFLVVNKCWGSSLVVVKCPRKLLWQKVKMAILLLTTTNAHDQGPRCQGRRSWR
jgi:hypothetical protein